MERPNVNDANVNAALQESQLVRDHREHRTSFEPSGRNKKNLHLEQWQHMATCYSETGTRNSAPQHPGANPGLRVRPIQGDLHRLHLRNCVALLGG